MEAKLKMRIEYSEPHSQQLEVPFINVLPSQPYEAYRRFKGDQLETIRKTEKIPFSSIRELILMYNLKSDIVIDVAQSDLFMEKLSNPKIQKYHNESNNILDNLLKEHKNLQKLREVTQKYIDVRSKAVSSDWRRNIKTKYDSSHLKNQIQKLQRKKEYDLKDIKQRMLRQSKKGGLSHQEEQKKKSQIQKQYNQAILALLDGILPDLKKLSWQFCSFFQNINYFRSYNQQFEKALVYIISSQKINNKTINKIDERILKSVFIGQLIKSSEYLHLQINSDLLKIFVWRMKVKYGEGIDIKIEQIEQLKKNIEQNIKKNVYENIPGIIALLKSDREQANIVEQQIRRSYKQFLPYYLKAKQVELFYKKQSKIDEILIKQKDRLISHLKKNYSMMVFYSKSQEYTICIEEYRTKSKGYLYDILKKKIGLLDVAITFINKDYGELYKEACDGKYGIRDKIGAKCKFLEDNLHENSTILSLLLESCRRLLNIARN